MSEYLKCPDYNNIVLSSPNFESFNCHFGKLIMYIYNKYVGLMPQNKTLKQEVCIFDWIYRVIAAN